MELIRLDVLGLLRVVRLLVAGTYGNGWAGLETEEQAAERGAEYLRMLEAKIREKLGD